MELKDFVAKTLDQIQQALEKSGNFELDDEIVFDVPIDTSQNTIRIACGESGDADLPRIVFEVELAKKPKAEKNKGEKSKDEKSKDEKSKDGKSKAKS